MGLSSSDSPQGKSEVRKVFPGLLLVFWVFKLRGRIGEGSDAMPPSSENLHFLPDSVLESLATLVLAHSIIAQEPFSILHSLPQFTALVLLGSSYVGKHLAKCSANNFPKLQILH
ncbi:hypothetical protein AMTR_s00119p00018560 [Amborella trichopoda]|uniref:Uncharacterized protein n=1 Tax=Amborella trichopoda TaxID=13333 RepID=W1NNC7_AMBTC|nr:hypothetical protein AMTR_s00119p00018560 [Amborella trichopoda]